MAEEKPPPAEISLTDCLACSGCVTSAEAVLVSLQSHSEVLSALDSAPEFRFDQRGFVGPNSSSSPESTATGVSESKIFVASVSPQARASLAATYQITHQQAGFMIEQFLSGPDGLRSGGNHGSGFSWVIDTNAMRQVCLELGAREAMEASTPNGALDSTQDSSPPKQPVLASACPGWICYAEKTHPHVLPHISRLRSPQALTGTLLKTALSKILGISPSRVFHLAVMPCFDKKLEASRSQLSDASWNPNASSNSSPAWDVDCVITSRELTMLAESRGISLPNLSLEPLPKSFCTPFPDPHISSFILPRYKYASTTSQSSDAGTSGGYLHYLLAKEQSLRPGSEIQARRGRNADVCDYTLVDREGKPILKAARYYGFRNIQNLVRKLKPTRTSKLPGAATAARAKRTTATAGSNSLGDYAYVEVMACPGGCTNGGGQIRLEDALELRKKASENEKGPDSVGESLDSNTQQSDPSSSPAVLDQRAWLTQVDEAYHSDGSDTTLDSTGSSESSASSASSISSSKSDSPIRAEAKNVDDAISMDEMLSHWSKTTNTPLSTLLYTTYEAVQSDVGKQNNSDTLRVAELAGKVGGGW